MLHTSLSAKKPALEARARRRRGLTPETSTEHVKIGWVNGRQTNAHKDLSRPRQWIRQIANTENVCRFAVALKDEGFHGALLSIRPDIQMSSGTALMLLARLLFRKILTTSHIATPQRVIEASSGINRRSHG